MLRDYLTNKWVLSAICFLIVFSVACVFWYRYDTAHDKQQLAKDEEMLRQRETSQKEETGTETEQTTDQTSVESNTLTVDKSITGTIGTVPIKNIELTSNNLELVDSVNETKNRVSPYGFGPYPYVPQGFIDAVGKPVWFIPDEIIRKSSKPPSRNVELMQRVLIKLWKQGRTDVEAAFMDGDRVIVHYQNRAYVRYETYNDEKGENVRYISSWRSASVPAPKAKHRSIYPPGEKDVDPSVELIDLDREDVGIDPYEFLGLK